MSGLTSEQRDTEPPTIPNPIVPLAAAVLLSWLRHHPTFTNAEFLSAYEKAQERAKQ